MIKGMSNVTGHACRSGARSEPFVWQTILYLVLLACGGKCQSALQASDRPPVVPHLFDWTTPDQFLLQPI